MENKKTNKKEWAPKGYFTVMDFMTVGLGLKGADLLTFALIYSFCNVGLEFTGSRAYVAAMTGLSIRSVERSLATLCEKGYIKCVGRVKSTSANAKYCIDNDKLVLDLYKVGWCDAGEEELFKETGWSDRRREIFFGKYIKRSALRKKEEKS